MKLVISKIPGDFPSGYNEQLYLDVRSVKSGSDFFIAETEEKYKVKNDETYEYRKIQSIFYDKYTIEVFATESIDIEKINIAGEIIIVQDNGEIHDAKIINFQEFAKLQNSEFRLYNLTYIDLNSKKVVNHLDVSDLTDGIIKFTDGAGNNYYSAIYPKFAISEFERTSNTDNYIEMVSSDNAFKTIDFITYLTQEEILAINTNNSANYISNMVITYNSTTYSSLEMPEIIIGESEMENLYPVTIRLKYEQILNYKYA